MPSPKILEIDVSDTTAVGDLVLADLRKAHTLDELTEYNLLHIVGTNSTLSLAAKAITRVPPEGKAEYGKKFNELKLKINDAYEKKRQELLRKSDQPDVIDVTLPVKPAPIGHLSPDTQIIRLMNSFFTYLGYSIAEGPDIETDEFNFEKTNLPKDHPARDLQDTIYIESPQVLLRTHTSSVETRILSTHQPPLRFVVPGNCYRNEVLNASNDAVFQQYQGVIVDKGISMANLKATFEEFAKFLYGNNVKTRFRTKYYPEVEPGAGMDILCPFCQGIGCGVCKGRGWMEILGSGLIHRNLLEKCGLDYKEWSGFAFGMGLDRIIMTKFGVNDIRKLHDGSLVIEG